MVSRSFRSTVILTLVFVLPAMFAHAQRNDTDNLVIAAISGDPDLVQQLLDEGSRIEQRLGGDTALTAAIKHNQLEIVNLLLEQGADPNAVCCGSPGKTALMLAVSGGHTELVRDLISRGADPEPVVDGEQASTTSGTMLYSAVQQRDIELVRLLIDLGASPDRTSLGGYTPLIWAAGGSPEIAQMLIDAGADVTPATDRGLTALAMAVGLSESSGVSLVNAMLDRGANVDHLYCSGWEDDPPSNMPGNRPYIRQWAARATALTVAARVGNDWAVEMLIGAGADLNLAQCDGRTPLELAQEYGHQSTAGLIADAMNAGEGQ